MVIRDFYFAAYIIEKGYSYEIINKKVDVNIDKATLKLYSEEYEAYKPMLTRVRSIIKELTSHT